MSGRNIVEPHPRPARRLVELRKPSSAYLLFFLLADYDDGGGVKEVLVV